MRLPCTRSGRRRSCRSFAMPAIPGLSPALLMHWCAPPMILLAVSASDRPDLMRGLIQRVSEACVRVEGELVGEVGPGILLLLGVHKGDTEAQALKLLEKVLAYRIFPDETGRMN